MPKKLKEFLKCYVELCTSFIKCLRGNDKCFISPDTKLPKKGEWVIGLCKLTIPSLADHPNVIFEVQYYPDDGWYDGWCDKDGDDHWKVVGWMYKPS